MWTALVCALTHSHRLFSFFYPPTHQRVHTSALGSGYRLLFHMSQLLEERWRGMEFARFSPQSPVYQPCPAPYHTALPSNATDTPPAWHPLPSMALNTSYPHRLPCIFTLNATHPGDGLEVEIANLFFPFVVDVYEARHYFDTRRMRGCGEPVELRRVTGEAVPVNGTYSEVAPVVVLSRTSPVIVVISFNRRSGYSSRAQTTPYTIRFRAKENGA